MHIASILRNHQPTWGQSTQSHRRLTFKKHVLNTLAYLILMAILRDGYCYDNVLQKWRLKHLPKVNESEHLDLDLGSLDSEFTLNHYAMLPLQLKNKLVSSPMVLVCKQSIGIHGPLWVEPSLT